MSAPGFIVAAHKSGAGKTTVTLSLLASLRRKGLSVRAAKAGPDFIDPVFHEHATGRPSVNLDSWAMAPGLLDSLVADASRDADLLVVEGVMGLFDGISCEPGRTGATADLAARFGLPVILVVDVSGQSQSTAALLRGFASHDPNVNIAGVILNRVGSARHLRLVREAVEMLEIPVLGSLPREAAIALPERHLGLVQAHEHDDLATKLTGLADFADRHFDMDAIRGVAMPPGNAGSGKGYALAPPGMRIAVAHDAAFTFLYPHLVQGWRGQGAELVPFSPLADEGPDRSCDVCWLPGGYPELHAGTLGAATGFKSQLAEFAQTRPVHGECGGYMVLGQGLVDREGTAHAMAGLLRHATSFADRKLHLGYRQARLLSDCVLGRAGMHVRGHEFHYASVTDAGTDGSFAEVSDGEGRALGTAGGRRGNVTGTFFHAVAAGS